MKRYCPILLVQICPLQNTLNTSNHTSKYSLNFTSAVLQQLCFYRSGPCHGRQVVVFTEEECERRRHLRQVVIWRNGRAVVMRILLLASEVVLNKVVFLVKLGIVDQWPGVITVKLLLWLFLTMWARKWIPNYIKGTLWRVVSGRLTKIWWQKLENFM